MTARQVGSQRREPIAETEYVVERRIDATTVILRDTDTNDFELYVANDHYVGWVVEIDGVGYEFVRSAARMEDLHVA